MASFLHCESSSKILEMGIVCGRFVACLTLRRWEKDQDVRYSVGQCRFNQDGLVACRRRRRGCVQEKSPCQVPRARYSGRIRLVFTWAVQLELTKPSSMTPRNAHVRLQEACPRSRSLMVSGPSRFQEACWPGREK